MLIKNIVKIIPGDLHNNLNFWVEFFFWYNTKFLLKQQPQVWISSFTFYLLIKTK